MLRARSRQVVRPLVQGVARQLARLGFSANAITALAMLFGLISAILAGLGLWGLAICPWVVSGSADCLDGAGARATRGGSSFGRFIDSATDKTTETALYVGIACGAPEMMLPALAATASFLLCGYVSKSAQTFGQGRPGGFFERTERAVAAAAVLALLQLGRAEAAAILLSLVAAASLLTFLQRLWQVSRALARAERGQHGKARSAGLKRPGSSPAPGG